MPSPLPSDSFWKKSFISHDARVAHICSSENSPHGSRLARTVPCRGKGGREGQKSEITATRAQPLTLGLFPAHRSRTMPLAITAAHSVAHFSLSRANAALTHYLTH